ncbi:carboxypeptidase Q isoform X2 [Selaginella moellendorffii]|uniref:carboxypeptidase Q isoform X2 n=1 Tax=Selaginella moellendorffii TaxID=88036 RepID=UPI000D1C3A43|nr:carboxypeptidase Q isoform X2 [Selaginella moellendorffii]|eukprot:XP_024532914.1 carboxypeptidase Q isoform X2 [Selaginella moellendorffii]
MGRPIQWRTVLFIPCRPSLWQGLVLPGEMALWLLVAILVLVSAYQAKDDADAIIDAAFSSDIVYERIACMTDTFGPRFSGSDALENALDWTREEMEKDGLSVVEEYVMVPSWVRGREFARLLSPRVKELHMVGLGMSVGTPGKKSLVAKAIVVSSFQELDQRASDVQGKIVVYNVNFDQGYSNTVKYRTLGATRAEKYGAVAALVHSMTPYGLQTPHTGATRTTGIPSAAISVEDSRMLARMQARGQEIVIELYMEAHMLPDKPSRNLIVEIKGAEKPDEVVVFGGHMDSWDIADGAMDDAGGAFVSWEVVRLIHQLKLRPHRTLRAVLFVNEENGAKGAEQYYLNHKHESKLTSIAIESDEGTFTPLGISFQGSTAARSILEQIGKAFLAGIGSGNVSGQSIGTDISPMCDAGVPCGSLVTLDPRVGSLSNNPCKTFSNPPYPDVNFGTSGYFWYHHTQSDTVDKLSPRQLQHCAATLAVWTYSIANLDFLLPRS